jgi:hypothetical protein
MTTPKELADLRETLLDALTKELDRGWLPALTDPYQLALMLMEHVQPIIRAHEQELAEELRKLAAERRDMKDRGGLIRGFRLLGRAEGLEQAAQMVEERLNG